MKLLKPDWINHDGKAIFAVDIHPDGSRFATGGQGEDAGMIIIWNIAPVVSEIHEMDENTPKMLCQLDDHTACVNCLRWSNSGKYLASGGDDKMVIVWQMSRMSGSSTVFGTGGAVVNIENWRCIHILRGHLGDILDIAWSPDDSYIATGSVDNTIIIWNAQKFPEIHHVIKGHEGLVKGVTFDPVGKYLASQSDDKSLCVWNTSDWSLEKKITEPFIESSGTTHALRLNWSPDGQYVVSAHAMNNGGPVAKIVERNGWKSRMDFVGHRKAVTSVRFNNRLLIREDTTKSQYVCCAVGSRDRSISIWLTSLKRPLVVIHDLFENSVMDISWSHCGYYLVACSLDGTVVYLDFSKEELGKAMSSEDKYIYHKKTYGTSIKASKSLIISSIIENPDFLKHQQQQQEEWAKKANLLNRNLSSSNLGLTSPLGKSASTPFKTTDVKHSGGLSSSSSHAKLESMDILKKQKELKTKDGKRRIVPMLLEPPPDFVNDGPCLIDFITESNKDAKENVATFSMPTQHEKFSLSTLSAAPKSTNPNKTPAESTSTTATSISVKRKIGTVDSVVTKKSKKKKDKDKEKLSKNNIINTPVKTQNEKTINNTLLAGPSLYIPCPELEGRLSLQVILPSLKQNVKATLEVENDLSEGSGSTFHYLRCVVEENMSWETCLTSAVNALAANQYMICTSCQNRTIHVFSCRGRRLLPALVVDSKISQLQCQKHFLMAITTSGNVNVWNIKNKCVVIGKESLLPILTDRNESITHSFVNEKGCPVITLSDHSVYTFDPLLSSWTLLASACDSMQLTSDIGSCLIGVIPKGPLHSAQAPLNRLSKQMMRGLRMNPTKQQTSTSAYLESQVCAALSINSPEEYHFWLMTYARYIVQSGEEERLRDLCEELLGPLHGSKQSDISQWKSRILCYSKRDLLKDLLPIIASNLRFQRFYSEFQQQLEMITKR